MIKQKMTIVAFFILLLSAFSANVALAHCDTMDGPLIGDARKAIAHDNVNYALKWVFPADESEVREAFILMMKVRGLSPDARVLAENYFFETLVRLHRSGEGVPYTGIKPSGTPIDEKVLAADKSIETGNLTPLISMVPTDDQPELAERFDRVMALRNHDVDNVDAGREYIEAYVQFFKFAEGETEGHGHHQVEH
jgi:hypothetical protein